MARQLLLSAAKHCFIVSTEGGHFQIPPIVFPLEIFCADGVHPEKN